MPDCMSFPENIMDFIDDYSFEDSDHVYTNGSKLISSFRVKQAIEHYFREQEPMEPHWRCPTVYMNGTGKIELICGNCGISIPLGKPNYCPWCGRKVKWDETVQDVETKTL